MPADETWSAGGLSFDCPARARVVVTRSALLPFRWRAAEGGAAEEGDGLLQGGRWARTDAVHGDSSAAEQQDLELEKTPGALPFAVPPTRLDTGTMGTGTMVRQEPFGIVHERASATSGGPASSACPVYGVAS